MSPIKSRKHANTLRSSNQPLLAALTTGMALAFPVSAALAQNEHLMPDSANAAELNTISVEGFSNDGYKVDELASPKFVKPLVDTTQTIQVISSQLFDNQGATTLTEALRNSPGTGTFYVGENGNTTTGDAVNLRGFDASSSIFVDGMRDLGTASRDLFNIDQIEVTKGAAGTDYGRSAPGGVINMVSKQAMAGNALSAAISLGTDSQQRMTADWNSSINDSSAFRLNVMAQDSGVPGRDEVENNRWGIAPSLAFGLGTTTRLYLNYLYVKQENLPDGGVFTIGLPGYTSPDPERPQIGEAPMVDPDNFYGTTSDYDNADSNMFTARVEHDFDNGMALQNTTRWGRNSQDYMLTAYRGNSESIVTPDLNDPTTWSMTRSIPTFKDQVYDILANQTNLLMHMESGSVENDLSVGIELSREELDGKGIGVLDDTSWPAANIYAPNPDVTGLTWGPTGAKYSGSSDTVAVYAFNTVTLNEQWQLNAGARLDNYETDFDSVVICGSRGAPVCGDLPPGTLITGVDDRIRDNLFSWKLGALYKPAENGSIYANYEISQQPPGGGSLELSASANNLNNPIYDPQESDTAEIGTKWELIDQKLFLSAALYRTNITNELVQDPVDLNYYQTGEKRVQGIELGVVGNINPNWSISAGYTSMDADVVDGTNVAQDGSAGLTYTPEHAFTSWTTYRLPFNLTIGGGVRYSGALKRGTDGALGTPESTDSYWVVDAVVSYAFNEHVDLQLNAYNLFDEEYVAAINKSGYRYTPGVPRSFLLTANLSF
ncbi:catecholate siderophore receptor Fiu [Dokdonella sp.]|uniref:catecholate siderophore receptor Fiu n=1 Tax=Dokdonella sp. TaxID=2291710 RepID=UPI003C620B96